ncbi:MAG: helix-turn-helix domain-containing protein [Bacteroidaceae bacterium]|nr:helix-turn-helix domain-containing protein [Bacteroidaceae bacterium]
MEIQDLKPRKGNDTYRIDDSDDVVVMENIGKVPSGAICLQNHGIIIFCTKGRAQFEYDGNVVQIQKNDLFLYMVHSTVSNLMASPDFNCRQIWFSRSELWNINIYNQIHLTDLSLLKLQPVVHLTHDDIKFCDTYFQLLCNRMKYLTSPLSSNIVHSLLGTFLLEILAMMRHNSERAVERGHQKGPDTFFYKKRIIDNFMRLVENSDGRIRRVNEFAAQLNVTPKYLSTILKEVMNRKPSVYIQLYTLKAIEYRLRFTGMTMQEISYDLNFPNPSFFGKYCKEHLGMTPMEYRMKFQKGK